MPYMPRIPEEQEVDVNALNVFSRVARWGGRAAAMRVRKILGSSLKSGMTVLDIGTGPGSIPLYLKQLYPDIGFTGLDISMGMLEKAKENKKVLRREVNLLAGNGEALPFKPQTVDAITLFFALHHMDRPDHLLKEIDRVLKPNGLFLAIDFRRDMPGWLYHTLNGLWQGVFFFSNGRFGIRESIQAAWRPVEIETVLRDTKLKGFAVHENLMELWIHKGIVNSK